MKVSVETTSIPDVLKVRHQVFEDERGFFMEAYRRDEFERQGLPAAFVQLNHSRSAKGVLRGLHFQWDPPMGKLMRVISGTAFLVAVDVRKGSPTLGEWFGTRLSAGDPTQLWAPAGFARGFCALSDGVEIQYLCTGIYNAAGEGGILWNDPELAIDWPIERPILSPKDQDMPPLGRWLERAESDHFQFQREAP